MNDNIIHNIIGIQNIVKNEVNDDDETLSSKPIGLEIKRKKGSKNI